MIDTKLQDKVVVVTGANHGIGAATAVALVREGAKVFMNYLRLSPSKYGGISEEEAKKAAIPGRAYYHKMQAKSADEVIRDQYPPFFCFELLFYNTIPFLSAETYHRLIHHPQ